MNERLLHTPEGVRDVYDIECRRKKKLIGMLKSVMEKYSYHDIETPAFEYFDIFNRDKGSAKSNEMYKFFDRENNTLVLRPDMTPQIARCVAKYYKDVDLPIRLSYEGKVYKNLHNLQGKLSETTEVGGELINDDSSAADAEILATVIDCFLASGLTEFQIEVGNVNFFKGIVEEAGIDKNIEEKLRTYIHNKNSFGLSEYVKSLELSDKLTETFDRFYNLFGGVEMLDEALTLVDNPVSVEAIERLKRVYNALKVYGYEKHISFDLGLLSRYEYYTGIIFRGYTYGTGDAIVKGGRYNNLLSQFGKDAPAIGFCLVIDELMSALSRQDILIDVDYYDILMLYKREYQEDAIKEAIDLRKSGECVELIRMSERKSLDDYKVYAKEAHFDKIIYYGEEGRSCYE
ncbi:MAG: ATP phosphoribosyltransferase regulatory subunit [Lachnospiraceae bacterium]|nr:ATP phosphoribosyltransferase regulatory subunit [Lachnospiraceae bacterium]